MPNRPPISEVNAQSIEGVTAALSEKNRIERETVPAELNVNLEVLAKSYGIDPPYDFELASSILNEALIIRGRRPKR